MCDGRSIAVRDDNIFRFYRHLPAWLPTGRNRDHYLDNRYAGGPRLGGQSQGVENVVGSYSYHHKCLLFDLLGRHCPR